MIVLGIETSCDETSAGIVRNGREILANEIFSQTVHQEYGGVVPELASRSHVQMILPVVDKALKTAQLSLADLDLIAVTAQPGLIGALLVGLSFAKALAYAQKIPFVPVNHLESHVYAAFLEETVPQFPFLALVISGGHSELVVFRAHNQWEKIGQTVDDAAGECFDKIAKYLELGYPGGPIVSKLAQGGDESAYALPRPLAKEDSYNYSFSGLKTASILAINDAGEGFVQADFLASMQRAIIDSLWIKAKKALKQYRIRHFVVAGGVSANARLREIFAQQCDKIGVQLYVPRPVLCTDNGAMVGALGYYKWNFASTEEKHTFTDFLDVNASSQKGMR